MSILTPFFNLIKPQKTEGVKVSDFNANMDVIDTEMHRPPLTVNGIAPDPTTRDLTLRTVPLADNLTSDDAQLNVGMYLERTSGGSTPVHDGEAYLSSIKGNMVKTGYVPESLTMTVNAAQRVAPPAITAVLDNKTFETYVEGEPGTYTLTYEDDAWTETPSDYGVTVSNDPVDGDEIVIEWDGENDPVMTVNAVTRPVPAAITATIDRDTFVAYVATSGTITLNYTTSWSANPELYGITVSNEPIAGDQIVVVYVKLNRGTITPAAVTSFNSTGWNLYDNVTSLARVIRYSADYGYFIGGNYSILQFSTTPDGEKSFVTVNDGFFNIPSDGFITVTGGDSTTYIFPTWTDWLEGYEGDFEAYTVDTISLSEIMVNFPGGLFAIGETRDEINFNIQKAISRIQRINYSDADLATVIASGRPYDTDTNYIYVVRETPVETAFSVDGSYTVSDHGIEFFIATTAIPVICETLYGQNLKDKLRMDVLTISQQTLTDPQKAQARENIEAADAEETKAAMGIVENGNNATQNIAAGEFVIWKGGVYTADSAISTGATFVASGTGKNLTAATKGGFNVLNSNIIAFAGEVPEASNLNNLSKGIYRGIDNSSSYASNGFPVQSVWVLVSTFSFEATSGIRKWQIAMALSGTPSIYLRCYVSTGWAAWRTL